ncbi:Zn-dependent hydrolase [Cryobacterium sp. CG_9.6]|uniref:Zn-dependent hydrolase n=1 Tax=Cryobacterium sp. CG_9.6 TaxID=2760710 RepID=UPI0024736839|nr:Zn-dependent hydrolase [Cryobacterium sp. CG_9.6]MDH6235693.1 N-carbamoyl-L-amino-acid hydrolase [Cryobacterium sp. CG_9.6]
MTGASARLSVNGPRLIADLETLAQIGRGPGGGLDRTSFSAADSEARAWLLRRCAEAGLRVHTDGIGNFVMSPDYDAETAGRPAVWSGSHIDTVPNGGDFDGSLGVLAALECLRRIQEERPTLDRPVRAIMFTDEEGNYAHLFGSSALARGFSRAELEALTGRDGDRFVDTFSAAGGDLDAAANTKLNPAMLHATVELHIEQGPFLEQLGHDIGVVTGIVALGGGVVSFLGRADHAGTTPMDRRQNALTAAGALLVALPEVAANVSANAVVTSGIVTVEPGSANVVPGAARVTVDFREAETHLVSALEAGIVAAAQDIALRYGVQAEFDFETTIPPVLLDNGIQTVIAAAATARGLSHSALPSGAGHDSQNMAQLAPTGMIFVPSIDGRSHCPEEKTAWSDVENGANVLLDTLLNLARD